MALMESTMVPLGTPCPPFTLPGVDGRLWSRDDFHTPALLLVIMCNHCPYVQAVEGRLDTLARAYAGRCAVVGINPNDAVAYPEDSFDKPTIVGRRSPWIALLARQDGFDSCPYIIAQ